MTVNKLRKLLETFPDDAVVLAHTTGDTVEPYRPGLRPRLVRVYRMSDGYRPVDYEDLDYDASDDDAEDHVVLSEYQAVVL